MRRSLILCCVIACAGCNKGTPTAPERASVKPGAKDAVAAYHNAPQSARSALNAVKKVEARTEVGINYNDYSTVVGEAWGDVKIFVESPEGKSLPAFSLLLTKAARDYKLALDIWQNKIQFDWLYAHRADVETLQQTCWIRASKWIRMADSLLDAEQTENVLKTVAAVPGNEEDFDAVWKRIKDNAYKDYKAETKKEQADFDARMKKSEEDSKAATKRIQEENEASPSSPVIDVSSCGARGGSEKSSLQTRHWSGGQP